MKFRTILSLILVVGVLLGLSATANAQRPNPEDRRIANARQYGPCRDPWITIAVWENNGSTSNPQGVADAGECDPNLYGGSWSSYDQLYKVVEPTIRYLHNNGYSFRIVSDGRVGGSTSVLLVQNGTVTSQQVISNNLITSDGASLARIVASGGGNVLTNNGGTFRVGNSMLALRNGDVAGIVIDNGANITMKQGSNVVGPGGGSIQPLRSFSFTPARGYGLQSTGGNRLPKATVVIQ